MREPPPPAGFLHPTTAAESAPTAPRAQRVPKVAVRVLPAVRLHPSKKALERGQPCPRLLPFLLRGQGCPRSNAQLGDHDAPPTSAPAHSPSPCIAAEDSAPETQTRSSDSEPPRHLLRQALLHPPRPKSPSRSLADRKSTRLNSSHRT